MKSPFDVAKEINGKKRPWDEDIELAWNTYMINRTLSMDRESIEVIDHVQKYFNIPAKNVYNIYLEFIYHDRYYPYMKSKTSTSKDLKLIEEHFQIGNREARDYLSIISDDVLKDIRAKNSHKDFTISKIKKKWTHS
jgi:hypothetical protein